MLLFVISRVAIGEPWKDVLFVFFVQRRDKTHHPNIIEGKIFNLNNGTNVINQSLITNSDFLVHEGMHNSGQLITFKQCHLRIHKILLCIQFIISICLSQASAFSISLIVPSSHQQLLHQEPVITSEDSRALLSDTSHLILFKLLKTIILFN